MSEEDPDDDTVAKNCLLPVTVHDEDTVRIVVWIAMLASVAFC